jgi:hypothetical protein
MREVERQTADVANPDVAAIGARLRGALDALVEAGRFVVETYRADPRAVLAGAVSFLELAGIVCGGAQLARAATIAAGKLAAGDGDGAFMRAKIATARHFADHYLTRAAGLTETIVSGSAAALADEAF